jgi:hypothetical protein
MSVDRDFERGVRRSRFTTLNLLRGMDWDLCLSNYDDVEGKEPRQW